jgi:iron complex outermembrane recepter protein
MIRLLVLLSSVAVAATAWAGSPGDVDDEVSLEDEFEFLSEADTVVSAAKHEQKIGYSPSAVIVITAREIAESGAATFTDLMRLYPAVHVFLANPSHTNLHVRGSYRVLLMLDGRELNLELFPAPFYESIPVRLQDIERIEIVLGPNSALYGANAVAAVISIITRKPQEGFRADLSMAAGQNGAAVIGGLLEGGAGGVSFQGSYGIDRERSWEDRRQYPRDIQRANLTARWVTDSSELILNGSAMIGSVRLFSDAMGSMPLDFRMYHAKAEFSSGGFQARAWWLGLESSLTIDLDLKHPNDPGIELGRIPRIDLSGHTVQLEAQHDFEFFENNLFISGADFRFTLYRSDQIVDPSVSEYRFGLFVQDEHLFAGCLRLTASLRVDFNSRTRTAFSPKLALVYNPAGDHFIRLSGGTAFRKPTIIETATNFRIDADKAFPEVDVLFEDNGISNPDLENELLSTVELGYLGSLLDKRLRLAANIYFASNWNLIELAVDFRFQPPWYLQIDLANSELGYFNSTVTNHLVGLNLSVEGEPAEWLSLYLRADYYREWYARDTGWNPYRSRLQAVAGGTLRLRFGLTASLALVYSGVYEGDICRNPESVLAPSLVADIPAQIYLITAVFQRVKAGRFQVEAGLSFFNPFGATFREKLGLLDASGSSYGGERIGPRLMATARLSY